MPPKKKFLLCSARLALETFLSSTVIYNYIFKQIFARNCFLLLHPSSVALKVIVIIFMFSFLSNLDEVENTLKILIMKVFQTILDVSMRSSSLDRVKNGLKDMSNYG